MARRRESTTLVRIIALIFFIYYLFILFKTSVFTRFFTGNKMQGLIMIPFSSPFYSWKSFLDGLSFFKSSGFKALAGPIMIFLPMGFLLPFLHDKTKKLINVVGITSIFSLGIELIQYITRTGITSIDDFILNIIGSIFGFLLFKAMRFAFLNA